MARTTPWISAALPPFHFWQELSLLQIPWKWVGCTWCIAFRATSSSPPKNNCNYPPNGFTCFIFNNYISFHRNSHSICCSYTTKASLSLRRLSTSIKHEKNSGAKYLLLILLILFFFKTDKLTIAKKSWLHKRIGGKQWARAYMFKNS